MAVYQKLCSACEKKMVFLKNESTGKFVPVDFDSLLPAEQANVTRGLNLNYQKDYHKSHFLTCTKPADFSKKKRIKV